MRAQMINKPQTTPDLLAQKAARRRERVRSIIHRVRGELMKLRDPNQERAHQSALSRINRGDKIS